MARGSGWSFSQARRALDEVEELKFCDPRCLHHIRLCYGHGNGRCDQADLEVQPRKRLHLAFNLLDCGHDSPRFRPWFVRDSANALRARQCNAEMGGKSGEGNEFCQIHSPCSLAQAGRNASSLIRVDQTHRPAVTFRLSTEPFVSRTIRSSSPFCRAQFEGSALPLADDPSVQSSLLVQAERSALSVACTPDVKSFLFVRESGHAT
eukprot:6214120-Pleurochrysis_carterae.AAC.1